MTNRTHTATQSIHASILRRLVAMAYELLLLCGVIAVALLLPHILIGSVLHRTATTQVLWAHLFLVLLAYCCWFWCHKGQTLAMKTWHIRLVDQSGGPVRPLQALLRYSLCWPSIGIAGIGIAWAFIDRDGQFLHDRLADTKLIRS